jgi:hypothetical protein
MRDWENVIKFKKFWEFVDYSRINSCGTNMAVGCPWMEPGIYSLGTSQFPEMDFPQLHIN